VHLFFSGLYVIPNLFRNRKVNTLKRKMLKLIQHDNHNKLAGQRGMLPGSSGQAG